MNLGLGKCCPHCGAFHDEEYAKRFPVRARMLRELCDFFDPNFLCTMCSKPVERLSMGGLTICPSCDCGMNLRGGMYDE